MESWNITNTNEDEIDVFWIDDGIVASGGVGPCLRDKNRKNVYQNTMVLKKLIFSTSGAIVLDLLVNKSFMIHYSNHQPKKQYLYISSHAQI